MARPTSREKSATSLAVTLLRQHLAETMEQFAKRMGVALNTVSRWENSLPPTGKSLKRLYQVAKRHDSISAKVFMRAMKEEGNEAFQQLRTAQIMSAENVQRLREAFEKLYVLERDGGELDMPNTKKWDAFMELADVLFVGGSEEFLKYQGEI